MHGFIGEEINREAVNPNRHRQKINQDGEQEQHPSRVEQVLGFEPGQAPAQLLSEGRPGQGSRFGRSGLQKGTG